MSSKYRQSQSHHGLCIVGPTCLWMMIAGEAKGSEVHSDSGKC